MTHREMSIALGKTNNAVKSKCGVLKLIKPIDDRIALLKKVCFEANKSKMLTEEDEAFVRENYLSIPVKSLAKMLNRGQTSVRSSIQRQGLVIPQDLIDYRKDIGRKRKGEIAYNRGMKQITYMTPEAIERTVASRFAKGTIPPNTVAVGTEVVSKGGYIKVKIDEPNVWIFKQRLIWQQHFGEIPEKHIIIFLDENILNFDIQNLACIKRGQHINRECIRGKLLESRENLTDDYVAGVITRRTTLLKSDIPKPLIALKRESIKINRELNKIAQNESK
jgi:HNH endonuclease